MIYLRSLLFLLALVVITPPFSVISLLTLPLPPLARYRFISCWARAVIWLSAKVLRLRYQVEGLEHLPRQPSVILAKHQSAWETIAFQLIFPPHVHVLKRELLWVPFFGWGLALMSPIAIDRSRGRRALRRMAASGKKRLAQGFWIVIFPEGTRLAPGSRGKYHLGGAWLAARTGATVVPVAHNAGMYWGKNALIKRPGVIQVQVGPPIDPAGMTPEALNSQVENWIEARMAALCPQ